MKNKTKETLWFFLIGIWVIGFNKLAESQPLNVWWFLFTFLWVTPIGYITSRYLSIKFKD